MAAKLEYIFFLQLHGGKETKEEEKVEKSKVLQREREKILSRRVQVNADEITLKSLGTAFVSPCKWGYQEANKNETRARAHRLLPPPSSSSSTQHSSSTHTHTIRI